MSSLEKIDPEVAKAIEEDISRQEYKLQMIASENYVSRAVLEATASVLTNKYAEGYPRKRYYEGCENVDVAEELARERAKKLFEADHVNVQPHSGSQANMAAYFAFLEIGDKILGMNLAHGGHLTHGHSVNFSARIFKVVSYGVSPKTETIDYDELRRIAREEKPKLIVAGATAYPRIIDFALFREIADEVGAYLMTDIAHISGLIAAGLHPSPVPYAHVIPTSTHKTLRGPRGGMIICGAEHAKAVDRAVFPGTQGGPLMHIIAAKAVAFGEALKPEFKEYSAQIIKNARALADELMKQGFRLVSGGTDNHLLLVDLTKAGVTGKDAALALDRAGITANKNNIPFDTRSPFVTSGIRIGTPALTSRGMKEDEMKLIGGMIGEILRSSRDEKIISSVRNRVKELCSHFPIWYS